MTIRGEFVFSDDIRTEINGKLILIGVYSDGLVPASLPATFALSVWVRLRDLPIGKHEINVAFRIDGKVVHNIQLFVVVEQPEKPVQLILTGMPITFQTPCVLSVHLTNEKLGEFAIGVLPVEEPKPVPGAPQPVVSTQT